MGGVGQRWVAWDSAEWTTRMRKVHQCMDFNRLWTLPGQRDAQREKPKGHDQRRGPKAQNLREFTLRDRTVIPEEDLIPLGSLIPVDHLVP